MSSEFLTYVLAGFVAQLIDGALGMAYGITATSLLLASGLPPAVASATVHTAECATTAASAISHHAFGNVSRDLFRRLLLPGVLGAIVGALLLSVLPGDAIAPWVSAYLVIMGVVIVAKAFREFPPRTVTTHLAPLGFFGALIDAAGGGGWGPIVGSTLIVRGANIRLTVGSVNAVEFFVTLAASTTFFATLGVTHWPVVLGLALGGVLGAPVGAWACRHVPIKPFMVAVGLLVIGLSLRTLWRMFA